MKNSMLFKVLLAIALAFVAGLMTDPAAEIAGVKVVQLYGLLGQLFLNALSLVVVPLVSASIITGMARMGSDHSFGALGLKTFGYFILTTFAAICVGLGLALLIVPGSMAMDPVQGLELLMAAPIPQESAFTKVEQILFKLVPSNIVSAAAQGQMLGLILFCMVFGYFMTQIDTRYSSVILNFWQGIFQIMMKITHLVMKAMPFGVFGLVAKAVATTGIETVGAVAWFFLTVLLALFLYAFVLLPLVLKGVAGINPLQHIRAMTPALLTAFSTSSSAATLPVTLECVEKRAGVSNRISSFVLPLGTSVNLSGSALWVCISVLFVAQAYGVALTLPSIALVVLMILLASLGTAGVPSASMFTVIMILQTLGIPAEGIGLIMAVERFLDMFRTVVNVFGTSCCARLVASAEGEVAAAPTQPVTAP